MNGPINAALVTGAILSAASGVLHVGIVIGGPTWMRYFGAIERGVVAVEAGSLLPIVLGYGVALLWFVAAAYALSGAGVLPKWPLLKPALIVITSLYLLRGIAVVPIAMVLPNRLAFVVWSSVVFFIAGAVYFQGLVEVWRKI